MRLGNDAFIPLKIRCWLAHVRGELMRSLGLNARRMDHNLQPQLSRHIMCLGIRPNTIPMMQLGPFEQLQDMANPFLLGLGHAGLGAGEAYGAVGLIEEEVGLSPNQRSSTPRAARATSM